jgi:NitT/TauT family transport system ATP-binding protein
MESDFIRCDRVTRDFQTEGGGVVQALTPVDLTIRRNEFLCLLGPSGCGKTTLLNLIAGFIRPSSGQILIDGRPVSGPGPDRGVVFQDYSLFSWLTVRANVEFGPRMSRRSAAERRELSDHYLSLVGLSKFADKYPFELSGGMKQRVAIARSLVMRPQVLLMDEPFGALDAMTRGGLQSEVLDIQRKEEKTVVFVTHNIGEAIFLADRIVVMSSHPGRVKEVVDVDLARPRTRTTAHFNNLYEKLEGAIGFHAFE